jgi:hypothetical protein
MPAKKKDASEAMVEEANTAAVKEQILQELPEEMLEQAEASTKAANYQRKQEVTSGVGVLRTKGGKDGPTVRLSPSDIPYPEGIHGEDFEDYGPQGQAAVIPEDVEMVTFSAEQQFIIDPEMVRVLYFDKPGRDLPKKRLYNIKGIHRDGRIVQLAFEDQIQNNAGGDPEDAIGLRRYERKGIYLLFDWDTFTPIYCGAWGCWAQATQTGAFAGFCAMRHAQHTLPNRYKDAGEIGQGLMESGVTTSRVWAS